MQIRLVFADSVTYTDFVYSGYENIHRVKSVELFRYIVNKTTGMPSKDEQVLSFLKIPYKQAHLLLVTQPKFDDYTLKIWLVVQKFNGFCSIQSPRDNFITFITATYLVK